MGELQFVIPTCCFLPIQFTSILFILHQIHQRVSLSWKPEPYPPSWPLFSQDYSSQVWCGAILWPTVLCSSANWQSDSKQVDFKQEGHPHVLHIPQDQTRAVPLWWETYCSLTVMWFLTGTDFSAPLPSLRLPLCLWQSEGTSSPWTVPPLTTHLPCWRSYFGKGICPQSIQLHRPPFQ